MVSHPTSRLTTIAVRCSLKVLCMSLAMKAVSEFGSCLRRIGDADLHGGILVAAWH